MIDRRSVLPTVVTATLLTLTIAFSACTTAAPVDPAVVEIERERGLVDPRIGYSGVSTPDLDRRFDRAWSLLRQGRTAEAEQRLNDLLARNPQYAPATLALARIAFDRGNYAVSARLAEQVRGGKSGYVAADVLAAESALAQGDRRSALAIYQTIVSSPQAPAGVQAKIDQLRKELFEEIFARATSASGEEAIAALREALAMTESSAARTLLAQRLIEARRFEEASRELQPLIDRNEAERPEVQALLADIEVSRGRYEDAIVRLERLARRDSQLYGARLAAVKQQWHESTLPIQYRKAVESLAIDRGDLAVLIYWSVSPVRFASRVGAPPIAVDVNEVPGREELIRALALGLFQVDPVTREVNPYRVVNRAALVRILGRLISLRGTPKCAAGVTETNETRRFELMLATCGIDLTGVSDQGVSGRAVAAILQGVERVLTEQ